MFGKTNAGGGGSGSFAGSDDAVLRVITSAGSTVTISKNGITRTGSSWIISSSAEYAAYLFSINHLEFDSNTSWTITAVYGGSTKTDSIIIDTNKAYEVNMRSKLPMAYQEVAYLQSTGEEYIDTGIPANNISYCRVVGTITSNKTYALLFGACNATDKIENESGSTSVKSLAYRPYDGYFFISSNGKLMPNDTVKIRATTDFDFEFTYNGTSITSNITINGTTTTGTTSGTLSTLPSYNFWLFANNFKNTFNTSVKGVVAKITEVQLRTYSSSPVVTANLVPCYRVSDNEPGYYDIDRNQFLSNARMVNGASYGHFTLGPTVNS